MLSPRTAPVCAGEYVLWENAFSAAQLDAICRHGDALAKDGASWLGREAAIAWLHPRLEEMVLALNQQFFRYDLYGMDEKLCYAVHDAAHAPDVWDTDQSRARGAQRKISLHLQLSDDDAYESGDLQLQGDEIAAAPRTRGALIAFPSYVLYRVAPVVSGARKSLTVWALGPEFR